MLMPLPQKNVSEVMQCDVEMCNLGMTLSKLLVA